MTDATIQALRGLRDFTALQWYIVPLLAFLFYVYTDEIGRSRKSGDWNAIIAGAAVFGADFLNETLNGWILILNGRSALWTAPGPTALRTTVGWNIEIMFMFLLLGVVWYKSLSERKDAKIFGVDEKWFFAAAYSLVCVVVECVLNIGGLLVWEYPFWERTIPGLPLIFLLGYFWFFAWAILAVTRKSIKAKLIVVSAPFALAIVLNFIAGILGWNY